jgi:hypothetical protein
MKTRALALAAIPCLVLAAPTLLSYPGSALPGTFGILGPVPPNVATNAPSCGTCHSGMGNGMGLVVNVAPTERILTPSQAISITTSSTGGVTGSLGGFVSHVTRGALSAGANSQINLAADHVSHTSSSGPRTWTYGYTAPGTAGVVEIHSVVNTVNGDLSSAGDEWGFHGVVVGALQNTPSRMFVNAQGVTKKGDACVGSHGNVPVYGAINAPRVGQNWTTELHGAPPMTQVTMFIGVDPNFPPFDLGLIGITGCTLHVNPVLTKAGATGPGNAQRGEGKATLTLSLPPNANLAGAPLLAQIAILDFQNGRPIAVTMSNGIQGVIQP